MITKEINVLAGPDVFVISDEVGIKSQKGSGLVGHNDTAIHSKSLQNRLFSQKNCEKSAGHFWPILGHYWAILGLLGPF